MSFILRQSIRAARPVSIAFPTKRTFAISSMRALKESDRRELFSSLKYDLDEIVWEIVCGVTSAIFWTSYVRRGWDEVIEYEIRDTRYGGSDAPEKAADYERHKQDQLAKQKEGKNHWKPELASDSEEAVGYSWSCTL
ncbi:hypothetical protein BELL_1016g00030 [Botrytis elliptica]|uniref:Uncharacterized protein n=1 Tax=Botrytis elliptica TaxID=278938 RepID=A0A4Z1IV26_9HELO|nr:hypothetical protein BELL_1016g00030 [Botrytis elliptica]